MKPRLALVLLLVCALPLSASQFIELPFDKVVRSSVVIVRGTVGPVTASWDANREVIYSHADIYIDGYLKGNGPMTLPVREVGGTVDGYTVQAIGFPELRAGEEVVMFLTKWDDSSDFRIQAYNQGKFLLNRDSDGHGFLTRDPYAQGDGPNGGIEPLSVGNERARFSLEEFTSMIDAADRADRAQHRNE